MLCYKCCGNADYNRCGLCAPVVWALNHFDKKHVVEVMTKEDTKVAINRREALAMVSSPALLNEAIVRVLTCRDIGARLTNYGALEIPAHYWEPIEDKPTDAPRARRFLLQLLLSKNRDDALLVVVHSGRAHHAPGTLRLRPRTFGR